MEPGACLDVHRHFQNQRDREDEGWDVGAPALVLRDWVHGERTDQWPAPP